MARRAKVPAPKLPPMPPVTDAVGSSGLRKIGGYISADFLPQLQGVNGVQQYKEMANNDPLLAAMLFSISMLIRTVEWRVEAADESDAAAKAKEEVEDALFKKLSPSFSETVSEITSMFTYGFAPMEVVWRKTAEGMLVPGSIQLRNQESLVRWEYDPNTNKVLGMWQQDWEHPMVLIPMTRMLLFRTDSTLDNPEGRSVLRSSYVSWKRKKALEEAEGRIALRAAGVAVVRVPGDIMVEGANPTKLAAYQTLVTNLAGDRQGGLLLPSDVHPDSKEKLYSLEYVVADGRRSGDLTNLIERVDKRMASSVLADFLLLGQQAVGSFALSSDKTALFATALGAWLQVMQDVFQRQLMQRWWTLNGLDEALMPRLVPGDIESPDLTELAAYISALASAGAPLFPDKNLEVYLREAAKLPEPAEGAKSLVQAQADAVPDVPPASAGGGAVTVNGGPNAEAQAGKRTAI